MPGLRVGLCRILIAVVLALPAAPAGATGLTRARTASGVDWVSAGVGGIPGDTADIVVTGVTGPVTQAFLYWDGLASHVESDVYDNPTVSLDGIPITGNSLGDTSTNCWGNGSSRAFVADVTAYVTGNGTYTLSGLVTNPIYFANGASLVVLFDDGDPTNNHDLIFYEGNDGTDITHTYVLEDRGFHSFLDNIVYNGGNVYAQFHVADGQLVNGGADGDVTLHGNQGDLTIPDTVGLWDGQSVPMAGLSRSPGDALWDIATFDISPLFPAGGTYGVYIDSPPYPADCIALVAVIIDLPAAAGPRRAICGDGVLVPPEECDDGNRINGDCCDSNCHFEPVGTVCGNPGDPCLESLCDGAGTCDVEGSTCRRPVAPEAARLQLRHGRQDRLTWKWWTGVSAPSDYGDPRGPTSYDLCVLDKGTGSARLILHESLSAGEACGATPCWTQTATGYEYRNPDGPLQELTLRGGLPGRARITARSSRGLTLPPLPLAPPVLVRLRAQGGLCWASNFSTPTRNTRRRFESPGDAYYP